MAKNNSNNSKGSKASGEHHGGLALLGGLAVAAAAGAYYIYGHGHQDAQKKIKKIKGWAVKIKGDVLHKMESLKHIDEQIYQNVIDTVVKKYENVKNIDTTELAGISKELKGHWRNIKRELNAGSGTAKKTVKKVAKAVKKTAKAAKKAVTE